MIKTIVTGVDGSETAAQAARKAAELAAASGAELHVLSAYGKFEMQTFSSGHEEFTITSEEIARKTAEAALTWLRGEFPALAVTAGASEGKPAAALVRAAQRLGADVIVVGNKRVQGLGRMLGSVAHEVAGHASCDVYVAYTHER
jgi:nucleotide-binding universal stress UspA family protein